MFSDDDPWGWQFSEFEEAYELQPGMQMLAQQVLHALVALGECRPGPWHCAEQTGDNPYWPFALVNAAGTLRHERYVAAATDGCSRKRRTTRAASVGR